MSDTTLHMRSALAGVATPGRHGRLEGAPGVVVVEQAHIALATIIARRGRTADVLAALSRTYGVNAMDGPRRVASARITVAGISPGQWNASGEQAASGAFAATLRRTLDGVACVTDQTDSRIVLHVGGPSARDALAKGVPIDLDASVFGVGHVAQTVAGHIGLQIACIDDAPVFEILVAQSFATSFWTWLAASSAEFGYEVRV